MHLSFPLISRQSTQDPGAGRLKSGTVGLRNCSFESGIYCGQEYVGSKSPS